MWGSVGVWTIFADLFVALSRFHVLRVLHFAIAIFPLTHGILPPPPLPGQFHVSHRSSAHAPCLSLVQISCLSSLLPACPVFIVCSDFTFVIAFPRVARAYRLVRFHVCHRFSGGGGSCRRQGKSVAPSARRGEGLSGRCLGGSAGVAGAGVVVLLYE